MMRLATAASAASDNTSGANENQKPVFILPLMHEGVAKGLVISGVNPLHVFALAILPALPYKELDPSISLQERFASLPRFTDDPTLLMDGVTFQPHSHSASESYDLDGGIHFTCSLSTAGVAEPCEYSFELTKGIVRHVVVDKRGMLPKEPVDNAGTEKVVRMTKPMVRYLMPRAGVAILDQAATHQVFKARKDPAVQIPENNSAILLRNDTRAPHFANVTKRLINDLKNIDFIPAPKPPKFGDKVRRHLSVVPTISEPA